MGMHHPGKSSSDLSRVLVLNDPPVWLIRNTPWSLWFLDEMWAQEQFVHPGTFVLFHYEQRWGSARLNQSKIVSAPPGFRV
jgi:hypothetical protein